MPPPTAAPVGTEAVPNPNLNHLPSPDGCGNLITTSTPTSSLEPNATVWSTR